MNAQASAVYSVSSKIPGPVGLADRKSRVATPAACSDAAAVSSNEAQLELSACIQALATIISPFHSFLLDDAPGVSGIRPGYAASRKALAENGLTAATFILRTAHKH
jgi:hypothetical protein